MFSFSLGQGLVEHILMISHGIMVGNYVKRKNKWCLMKRWAKLPKVKKKGTFTVNGQRLKHYRNGESIGKRDDIPLTSS